MKIIIRITILLCLFSCSTSYAWQGRVVKVPDGDSIRVRKKKEIIEIRLYGIDCPEWNQKYGKQAKRFTQKLIQHKAVEVEPMDSDSYGRTVGLVSVGRKIINRELVRAGYAWVYPVNCKKQPLCAEFTKLEGKARKKKTGLWRQKKPLPPWEWRRKEKK